MGPRIGANASVRWALHCRPQLLFLHDRLFQGFDFLTPATPGQYTENLAPGINALISVTQDELVTEEGRF